MQVRLRISPQPSDDVAGMDGIDSEEFDVVLGVRGSAGATIDTDGQGVWVEVVEFLDIDLPVAVRHVDARDEAKLRELVSQAALRSDDTSAETDRQALDQIVEVLTTAEWGEVLYDDDALVSICEIVNASGRHVADLSDG